MNTWPWFDRRTLRCTRASENSSGLRAGATWPDSAFPPSYPSQARAMNWRGHLVIFKSDGGKLRLSLTMPLGAMSQCDVFLCNGHGPTSPLAVKGVSDFDNLSDLLAHLANSGFHLSPGL